MNNSVEGAVLAATPGKWALSPLSPTPALLASGTRWAPVSGVFGCKNIECLGLGRRALKSSKNILFLYEESLLSLLEM